MSRRARSLRLLLPLQLLLSAHSLGGGPAPLSCPPGTTLEARPSKSRATQIELCRDPKTGFCEGPYREVGSSGLILAQATCRADKFDGELRTYDDEGRLSHVVQLSNGREISTRLTRAGMEAVARELNSRARQKGNDGRWAVRDEHSMELTIVAGLMFDWFTPDEAVMRERLVADARICNMFKHVSSLQTLTTRYVDADGKNLLVVPLQRADCLK